ncbi:endonuclease SmrB [Parasalinivibrio latis]|uniref:endonuclease SmrB n=1 Tax=Parasalinivibrio latis TaxID=2952610 RepID=UPI0006D0E2F8
MSNKNDLHDDDDFSLFREAVQGVKKLEQDTINPTRRVITKNTQQRAKVRENRDHEHYFSDQFEPHLEEEGPTRYARSDVSKYEVKRLRRGVYVPDMFLDLHGMSQQEAKREIAALIAASIKEGIECVCVMHGIGKHILKQKVPLWLAQHPSVLAFHQAPLEFGGDGSLLVLVEVPK